MLARAVLPSYVSFTVTELPRLLAFPIRAEAMPGPKPVTRFISRLNAFSALLFSGALIARPPGIAALMIFLSAATRLGDPTYELRKMELPVEFI